MRPLAPPYDHCASGCALHLTGTTVGRQPLVLVGHAGIDVGGGVAGVATVVWNGQPSRVEFSGTLGFDDECLGELSVEVGKPDAPLDRLTFDVFSSTDGDRAFFILTGIGATDISGNENRIVPGTLGGPGDRLARDAMTCDQSTLRGVYAGLTRGDTAAGPMTVINRPVFDGDGGVVDPFTLVAAGRADRSVYTGTYTVDDDCHGTMTLSGEHFDADDTHVAHFYLSDRGDRIVWVITQGWLHGFAGVGIDPLGINGAVPGSAGEFNATISGFWERRS